MPNPRNPKSSIYPTANTGPFGENNKQYARPVKWAGRTDHNSQFKIIVFGLIFVVGLTVGALLLLIKLSNPPAL